jgi:pyridoxal phosphate enzyme (YggS family)
MKENIEEIREKMRLSAEKVGRNFDEITLVAVSKTHSIEKIREAMSQGLSVFGENKVQEAEGKIAELKTGEWHLIGHLQSNKARKAVKFFDVIQTVDSRELAERLERICFEENRESLSVFVQVDLAGETTKSGVLEDDLPNLIEFVKTCKHLKLLGLMIIPPYFDDVEKVRPYFRKLREIRDKIFPEGKLSMGMSHDFHIAIEEGATHIRVGTAIFGSRNYK